MFELEKEVVFEIIGGFRDEIVCLKIENFVVKSEEFDVL